MNEQEKHKGEKHIIEKAGFMMEISRKMFVIPGRKLSFRNQVVEVRDLKSVALVYARERFVKMRT